jgi:SAM-dependent methyltransferase
MSTPPATSDVAYDVLAPAYACLTAGYAHEHWLGALVQLAREHGLTGRAALDVACGTGSSMLPLIARGFEVTGVDRSQGMLAVAERRLAGAGRTAHCDMTAMPRLEAFDLVTCIDDALNHLLDPGELERALEGIARNLAPGGVAILDVNTLSTLRESFSTDFAASDERTVVVWRGLGDPGLPAAGQTQAELMIVDLAAGGASTPERLLIEERHHPVARVLEGLGRAGLEAVAVHGTWPGGRLDRNARVDELAHHKCVVVARHSGDQRR